MNECDSAFSLCSVRGDDGSDVCTAMGTTSKWIQVRVYESVQSIISYPALSYTATLESPPGMTYDLFVYGGDAAAPDCAAIPDLATGEPASFDSRWDDTINFDDSRWIALHVRYFAGSECGPPAEWTLTVAGHTSP